MKSLLKKKRQRRFFDVHSSRPHDAKRGRWHLLYGQVVNLKPLFSERYRPWIVVALLAGAGIGLLTVDKFFARAEVIDFYPSACLGTWQNPDLAEGVPQTFGARETAMSGENSSRYAEKDQEIFCGRFLPDTFEPKGEIESVGITMVWMVGEHASSSPSPEPANIPPPEDVSPQDAPGNAPEEDTAASTTTGVTPPPPQETPLEENPSSPAPEPPPSAPPGEEGAPAPDVPAENPENVPPSAPDIPPPPPTSLLRFLLGFLRAEAQEVPEAPPHESSSVQGAATASPPAAASIEEPDVSADETTSTPMATPEEPRADTTSPEGEVPVPDAPPQDSEHVPAGAPSTSTPVAATLEEPDANFLQISYSTGGEEWIKLEKVSEENWKHFTIALPALPWNQLRSLQVRIGGIPSALATIPPVLLDGMLLEIRYRVPAALSLWGDASQEPLAPQPPSVLDAMRQELEGEIQKKTVVSQQPQASDWVAFKAENGRQFDVYLKNRKTGEVTRITETPSNESEPVIGYGKVAWAYATGFAGKERGEIYAYDMETGVIEKITDDEFVDQLPGFMEGALVWEKIDARGVRHEFSYDFTAREARQRSAQPFIRESAPEEGETDNAEG